MKIRTGDHVVVISGKDKGKAGAVLRVLQSSNRVVVAGINMRVKHVRATPQRPGQRLEFEGSIHVSNVMLVDPKTKKRTRIGMRTDEKGRKQRIAKKSGDILVASKPVAPKAGAKTGRQAAVAGKKGKEEQAPEEAGKTLPSKKPFWKRVVNFGEEAVESDAGSQGKEDHSIAKATPPHHKSTARGG